MMHKMAKLRNQAQAEAARGDARASALEQLKAELSAKK